MGDNLPKTEQKELVYIRPKHFSYLENMRAKEQLCDITIEVDGQNFRAHKLILAAAISYFQRMFLSSFEESNKTLISVTNIKATNMELFITFAYTGKITLTQENALSLLVDADYLDLTDIKEECAKFLESCLHTGNIFEVYYFADTLNCTSLQNKSNKFIQHNFEDVSQTEQYLNIDIALLKDILYSEYVTSVLPEKLYEGMMRWVKNDIDERQQYLLDLLPLVRLEDLTIDYLIDYVVKDVLIDKSEACRDLVNELIYTQVKARKLNLVGEVNPSDYSSGGANAHIFVMGVFDSRAIEMYNTCTDTWKMYPGTFNPRKWYSCAVYDNALYLIGGKVGTEIVASVLVYEPEREAIKVISEMNSKRRYVGAAALNGYLYVCGGNDGKEQLNSVERYSSQTNEWNRMSSMNHPRDDHAVVSYQGYLYAIGGSNGQTVLDSIERYDPRSGQWTTLQSVLNEKRFSFGAAVLNGKLYVCGGSTTKLLIPLNSVEVYNTKLKKWEYVASMNTPRWGLLVVACMGKLWAIGGWNGSAPISTIEVYDPKINVWFYVPSKCNIKGSVTGGAIPI